MAPRAVARPHCEPSRTRCGPWSHKDDDRLRVIAPDVGDLYMWTSDYGTYGDVELVIPPGGPAEWPIDTVDVSMAARASTSRCGRSRKAAPTSLSSWSYERSLPPSGEPRILNLHVM